MHSGARRSVVYYLETGRILKRSQATEKLPRTTVTQDARPLEAPILKVSGADADFWEIAVALSRGEAKLVPLVPGDLRELADGLSRLASLLRLAACVGPIADAKELAAKIVDPLVKAALAGRARSCASCATLWDASVVPYWKEDTFGVCPSCAASYRVELSAQRASDVLLGPGAKPLASRSDTHVSESAGKPGAWF